MNRPTPNQSEHVGNAITQGSGKPLRHVVMCGPSLNQSNMGDRLLIATRLHGYAMALAVGVPAIGIAFHPKIHGLAQEVGLVDWVFPIEQLDANRLINTSRTILTDLPAARDRVQVNVRRAAARARADFLRGVTGQPIRAVA